MNRLPPHNLDAERSVLGSCLLSGDALDLVAPLLGGGEHFYADAHRRVWCGLRRLREAGTPLDAVTLAEDLLGHGELEEVGGDLAIHELLETVPHAAHAEFYAKIVREKSTRRKLIYAATEIMRQAYGPQDGGEGELFTDELLAQADAALIGVLDQHAGGTGDGPYDFQTALLETLEFLEGGQPAGIPTGYPDLDDKLGGWKPGAFIIIGGRASMGKTALAVNLIEKIVALGHGVLFFSIEQTKYEIAARFLSLDSGISAFALANGQVGGQHETLLESLNRIGGRPLRIDESHGELSAIESIARKEHRQTGFRVLVVDYLQLIEPPAELRGGRGVNREQQVAECSRRLKRLAKQLSITVIALAQLNREPASREKDPRPRLSDLRESGSLEQDCDVALFVHRPAYYDETAHPSACELLVRKNRNGATGIVPLHWEPACMRFESAAPDWQELWAPAHAGHGEDGF